MTAKKTMSDWLKPERHKMKKEAEEECRKLKEQIFGRKSLDVIIYYIVGFETCQ